MCIVSPPNCRITEEFPETIKQGNGYLKHLNFIFDNLNETISMVILHSNEVRSLLYEKLIKPLNACMLDTMFKKLEYSPEKLNYDLQGDD